MNQPTYWAILRRSDNNLDGYTEWLAGDWEYGNYLGVKLFHTRREARKWCQDRHGYIKNRPDLLAEPHGWKPAKVVRVSVTYEVLT